MVYAIWPVCALNRMKTTKEIAMVPTVLSTVYTPWSVMVRAIKSVSSPRSVISTAEIAQAIVLLGVRTTRWVI